MTNHTRPTPVQSLGTPTYTSTANAKMTSTSIATAHKRTGNSFSPYVPSTKQNAPTKPAMPIPAVKNSNTKSDRPMANNNYATGGLATVCINCPSNPSLKKRAVVSSRTICPLLSTFSTTVSNTPPFTFSPPS